MRNHKQNLVDDGAWSSLGYRTTWQLLKFRGFQVPWLLVETVLREVDPEGVDIFPQGLISHGIQTVMTN